MEELSNQSRPAGSIEASDRLAGSITILRPVLPGDLPRMQTWDHDPVIAALMGRKYDGISAQEWYETIRTERHSRAWAIVTPEDRLIGEVELVHLNWRAGTAELRICIGEKDCWSQGFGSDAMRTALRAAFDLYGLRSVYLRVFATNSRALRVYERLGFRREAVLTPSLRRQDPASIILMSLTRDRWAFSTSSVS